MAQAPTQEQIEQTKAASEAIVAEKIKAQQEEGREFVLTGAGVIPEETWKAMKQ